MTIANHMLAGASIGLAVSNPAVAIGASLCSHYAMDAMPHFGYRKSGYEEALKHKTTIWVLIIASIQVVILISLLLSGKHLFALFTAFIALMPDIISTVDFLFFEKKYKQSPKLIKIHQDGLHKPIQKFERPWGLLVELIASILLTYVVLIVLT